MNSFPIEDLSHDAQMIISYVQLEFDKMKTDFTALINKKDEEIQVLKTEVSTLKKEVTKLECLIDDSDAYERRDTLIFSGPAVPSGSQGENCSEIVQKIAKDKLNCIISPTDISTAHRLGKHQSQRTDTRSIIVKFCRRDIKNQLYAAKRNQPDPIRVYVNESITQPRQNVYHTLRKIKKSCPNLLAGVSTHDGRVYAYTKVENASSAASSQRDRRHLVNNQEMLQKFCEEFLKRPLSNFLDSFN